PSPLVGEGAPKGRMRGVGQNANVSFLPAPLIRLGAARRSTFSHKGRRGRASLSASSSRKMRRAERGASIRDPCRDASGKASSGGARPCPENETRKRKLILAARRRAIIDL